MTKIETVLADIGAADVPQLLVFNKLDALDKARWPLQLQDMLTVDGQQVPRIFLSAQSGEGLPQLRQLLSAHAAVGNALDTPETSEVVV